MISNHYSGKFMAFEGIEGSGKTTQAKLLFEKMKARSLAAIQTKEPTTEGVFGKLARFVYGFEPPGKGGRKELEKCLAHQDYRAIKNMMTEEERVQINEAEKQVSETKDGNGIRIQTLIQKCMMLDRLDHRLRTEIPMLKQGVNVVTDRDFFSTLAYGTVDGINWRDLLSEHERILGEAFVVPDVIFFIDVPVAVGLERTMTKQNGRAEYFDSEERLTKIRQAYLEITRDEEIRKKIKIYEINGLLKPDEAHDLLWEILRGLFFR